ncbi:Uncharacterised protein [Mycobacteroides abscessus subsp. abscessus]|nr:Uncharacterised protein [Mycobacteroides abscessus subsp. abscessus]
MRMSTRIPASAAARAWSGVRSLNTPSICGRLSGSRVVAAPRPTNCAPGPSGDDQTCNSLQRPRSALGADAATELRKVAVTVSPAVT